MKEYNPEICFKDISKALNTYCDKICNKLSKDQALFTFWKTAIVTEYKNRTLNNPTFDQRSSSGLRDENISNKDKKYLKWLHKYFVITPVDKAGQNLAITCKKFYLVQIYKELGISEDQSPVISNSTVYSTINGNPLDSIRKEVESLLDERVGMNSKLSNIYLIPKFHKTPVKFRTIIASKRAVTKPVSGKLVCILKKVQDLRKNYCYGIYKCTGINPYWIIDNNRKILSDMKLLSSKNLARTVETYDFTTLYTTLEHTLIYESMERLLTLSLRNKKIKVVNNICYVNDE